MKTKNFKKKLQLNKQTITTFEKEQMAYVKGGDETLMTACYKYTCCSTCYSATWYQCDSEVNCEM